MGVYFRFFSEVVRLAMTSALMGSRPSAGARGRSSPSTSSSLPPVVPKASTPRVASTSSALPSIASLHPSPPLAQPSTLETVAELKERLAKELYRIELDLQGGGRIAGKPCDCMTRAKHSGAIEATAEELMSYERNPIYGQVVDWIHRHVDEFEPLEIAKHEPAYYQAMTPDIREFRKTVMEKKRG